MPDSTSIVIFGASGDLSHIKLIPALYQPLPQKAHAGAVQDFRHRRTKLDR